MGIACSGLNCDTDGMYSPEVLNHFKNPHHAGAQENGGTVVEVTNPVCGDTLSLSARLDAGRIADARFLAKGCVTSIACGSVLADLMQGATPAELARLRRSKSLGSLAGYPQRHSTGRNWPVMLLRRCWINSPPKRYRHKLTVLSSRVFQTNHVFHTFAALCVVPHKLLTDPCFSIFVT